MTMAPVYLVTIPGNNPIEISQDELRSLLREIESELHQSKVYRRALATLQQLLGASAEQAKILFKAVSREAIGLAFQQFATHGQQVVDSSTQTDDTNISARVEQEKLENSAQRLTSVKSHAQESIANTTLGNSPTQTNTSVDVAKTPESKFPTAWMKRFNLNKQTSNAEQNKLTASEEYAVSLREISQQLRQARESKGLSLMQLQAYTLIPLHYMEALDNGNLDLLPEDVFIRGFIRITGNALGLNGTALAASLPKPETVKSVLPSWCQAKKASEVSGLEIRPMHLYVGYTALVAGAVGGLSLISQQANSEKTLQVNVDSQPSSSLSQFKQKTETTTKPGIKSSSTSVIVGPDISPPEAL
ncbi:MAG: helix-turn-helix domain-containing protein [Aulosira sp. ZfuVER01]|nr:helix-turn-helix domain-containing protein [Aulosira sp. ZfuVER01]MDZ7998738.1 helix-turn-helix domain-containing protein [Aulosira sp. DedVER01a]MDZ8053914.1 helix-turn-helix domain-containing protein [Aulosira sp. ZfuCHP01]